MNKTKVERDHLYQAASKAAKITTSKALKKVYECLYFETKGDYLFISSLSNDIMIETKIPVIQTSGKISCLVEASIFLNVLSKIKNHEIVLEKIADCLFLRGGFVDVKIHCLKDSWIPMKELKDLDFVAQTDFLMQAVLDCKHSLGERTSQPLTDCFCIQSHENDWRVMSLDGFRISERGNSFSGHDYEFLVSGHAMLIAQSVLNEDIRIEMKDEELIISDNETRILLRTKDGKFFKIDQFITKKYPICVKVKRKELIELLEIACVLSPAAEKKATKLEILQNKLKVSTNSKFENNLDSEIHVQSNCGQSFKIGVNPKFMLELLNSISDKEIFIEFEDSKTPFRVKGDKYTEILFPVQLK